MGRLAGSRHDTIQNMINNVPERNCYCNERKENPAVAESMQDIPEGYCGICEVCGKPGHTNAHPQLPTTGSWCDKHWDELVSQKVVNLPQLIFCFILAALVLFILYLVRYPVAEFPLHFYSAFYQDKCREEQFEGKSATARAVSQYIIKECSSVQNRKTLPVQLANFTPFKWDTLHVITPYSMKMSVFEQAGLHGTVLACSHSAFYDEWTQLIFTLDGEVVDFFDISSYQLSFGSRKQYSIEEARFSVSCVDFHGDAQ